MNPSDGGALEIKAVLFDKDGTLVDFDRTWFRVLMGLAETSSQGNRDKAEHLIDLAGYDWSAERFRAGSVIAAGTIEEMIDLWHPGLDAGERTALIHAYDQRAVAEGSCKPIPVDGLFDTLALLEQQGFILGIATNDSEAGARGTADALGITDMFGTILGYNSVPRPKPHPEMLQYFASKHGLQPSQVAMVGDNIHDLEMARTAGAGLAIGVTSGTSTRGGLELLADAVLGSIAEVPDYLSNRLRLQGRTVVDRPSSNREL